MTVTFWSCDIYFCHDLEQWRGTDIAQGDCTLLCHTPFTIKTKLTYSNKLQKVPCSPQNNVHVCEKYGSSIWQLFDQHIGPIRSNLTFPLLFQRDVDGDDHLDDVDDDTLCRGRRQQQVGRRSKEGLRRASCITRRWIVSQLVYFG